MKTLYYLVLALILVIASCDSPTDNKSTKKKPPIPAGTTLTFAEATVTKPRRDNSYKQEVEIKTAVAEDKGAITYASDNPAVATVNETTGEVTFEEAEGGTVTITARKAGTPKKYKAQTAQYTLTIDHPDGSTITFETKTVEQAFKASFTYRQEARKERDVADDEGAITYTSNKPEVATVDKTTGKVIFVTAGEVTITARKAATHASKYKPSTAQYTLTIEEAEGTTLTFAEPTITKPRRNNNYTQTVTKKEVVEDDEGAITYASDNPAVATVNESTGEVTFEEAEGGTVTITARKAETPKKYKAQTAQYTLTIDHPDGSTIAFETKTVEQAFRAPFTYTQEARKERDVADDEGAITYTSNKPVVATVERSTGLVTLLKTGKVTITARKAATPAIKYIESEDSYTLTITRFKPTELSELQDEIREAMVARGNKVNLNYIDTSAITFMYHLFRYSSFAGDISKWDVSNVTNMYAMFSENKVFNGDISDWKVNNVEHMNGMFYGATAFTQNLNDWESRINTKIKEDNWANSYHMFRNSGLRNLPDWSKKPKPSHNLPNWCKETACKYRQFRLGRIPPMKK